MNTIRNAFGWLAIALYLVPGLPLALLVAFIYDAVHGPYRGSGNDEGIAKLLMWSISFSLIEWVSLFVGICFCYGIAWPLGIGVAMGVHFLWWFNE